MVMIGKNAHLVAILCLAAAGCLAGCAANSTGSLAKSAQYGSRVERRLISSDGKKLEEAMNTPGECEHRGDMDLAKGDFTAAFVNYERALQMDPGRISASYKTGRLFLLQGMTDEARAEFEKIIKKHPENALAHEGMGRAYLQDNDCEKAITFFLKALTINDRLWECHDLLGIAYDRQKKFSMAAQEYEAAISIKPDGGEIYNNLGVSYYLAGEPGKARDAFMTALERGEESGRVYNNLAVALNRLGQHGMAREALARAGSDAKAENNIGYLYLLDGKSKEAARAFEKAIELNPLFYGKAFDNLKTAKGSFKD